MHSSATISILIVDDHPMFRAGLTNMLAAEPDLRVVSAVATSEAALVAWEEHHPDVVLLDLNMPGAGGFEILRRLNALAADTKVLVLTSSDASEDVGHAARAGARGFVTKIADREEIVAAIRAVHDGETRFPDAPIGRRGVRGVPAVNPAPARLSAREVEVLTFLRHGYSNAAIARELGIAPRTAKAHVAALLEKLNAADRAEAVARGFDLGILKVAPPG